MTVPSGSGGRVVDHLDETLAAGDLTRARKLGVSGNAAAEWASEQRGSEMKAVVYARYSTDRQEESSIIDQLRRCREFATQRGWAVAEECTDEGISGAAIGNRPGVQRALGMLGDGDVLIVVDTTRLSRSQDLAPLVTRLRHRGVRVIGVLDRFDSDNPHWRMQAGLSGIMSEEFRAHISARTLSALDMRARGGKPTGGKCYGYSKSCEVIESEAEIVREIFSRTLAGPSQKKIAADLNARGVPAPGATWKRKKRRADGFWMVSAINAILANERYIGRVVWNKSQWKRDPDTGRRQRIERPESEWLITEGPVIVDRDTWDKVRAAVNPRRFHGGNRGGGPKYVLSGVLVCSECGGRLIATGKGGSYYYCGTHRHGGPAACAMDIGARRDVAEELILEPIRRDLLGSEAVDYALECIARWQREESTTPAKPADVAEIDRRIAKLDAQVAAGLLDREDIAPSLAALHDRRRGALAAAKRRTGNGAAFDTKSAATAYREAVEQMRELIAGPAAQARAAIHGLVGPVECRPASRHLVAMVRLNPVPLFKAAGFAQIGSGGRI